MSQQILMKAPVFSHDSYPAVQQLLDVHRGGIRLHKPNTADIRQACSQLSAQARGCDLSATAAQPGGAAAALAGEQPQQHSHEQQRHEQMQQHSREHAQP